MAIPNYKGQNQPVAASGSWLTNLFGGGTPAYVSAPASKPPTASTQTTSAQAATTPSVPTSQPFFAFAAPAYKLTAASTEDGCDETTLAIVIPQQSSDPQS